MVCVKPEKSQNVRRMAMRAGLELFAKHCQLFSDYIIKGEKGLMGTLNIVRLHQRQEALLVPGDSLLRIGLVKKNC